MRTDIMRRAARLAGRGRLSGPRRIRRGSTRFSATPIEEFKLVLDVTPGEYVSIALESVASEALLGAALVELRPLSASGARLSIPNWPHRSSRVAEYRYLEVGDGSDIAVTAIGFDVPQHAVRVELVGHRWRAAVATSVIGEPVVNRSSDHRWRFETDTGARLEHSAARLDRRLPIPEGASRVELRVEHVARGVASSGPLAVALFDAAGEQMLPLPSLPQHAAHGPFVQLSGDADEHHTTLVEFEVPSGAVAVGVRGIDWGERTARISGEISILGTSEVELSIEDFVARVPRDEQLVIVDTTAPPIGHATLGLRPNNLSTAYARAGRWVVFLPFSSLQEFGHDVGARLFQVPRAEVDRLWSAVREHRRGRGDVYICSSFPSLEAVAAASEAKRLGWTVTYEVRDDMEEFNRVGYSKWYTPMLEQQMLRSADRIVSVSRALDEKMETMHPALGPHTVIPNGVRVETIAAGEALRTRTAADRRAASATVGYVGHLTPSWFDWPLLLHVARRMPDVRFEIVGHGMPASLDLPENVAYLGPKSHDELVDIVAGWKVGIIPFRDIPLTRSVDPNKIYEYFAWGLRCVTVEMGAVSEYPWTQVYRDATSFARHLRSALEAPVTDEELEELESFVATVDWDSRATQMLSFIEDGVSR